MFLARVLGNVVATRKDPGLAGTKLLVIQPLRPDRSPWGSVAMRWLVSPISSHKVVCVPLPSLSRHAVRFRVRSGPSPENRAAYIALGAS